MNIRNAAKAIILHQNKILLNRCYSPGTGEYFSLPGGGQRPGESMEQALIRECREETGYTVIPEGFLALYEEIYTQESIRQPYPRHAHKILHIFKCRIDQAEPVRPTELDTWQRGSVWVEIADLGAITLHPAHVCEHLCALIQSDRPVYLGSHFTDLQEKA